MACCAKLSLLKNYGTLLASLVLLRHRILAKEWFILLGFLNLFHSMIILIIFITFHTWKRNVLFKELSLLLHVHFLVWNHFKNLLLSGILEVFLLFQDRVLITKVVGQVFNEIIDPLGINTIMNFALRMRLRNTRINLLVVVITQILSDLTLYNFCIFIKIVVQSMRRKLRL